MTTAQAIKQQMRVRYPEYFASPAPPPANVKVSGNAQALRGSVAVRVHSDTMLTWDDGRSLGGWGQLQARSPSARSWLEALILGVRKSLMVRGDPLDQRRRFSRIGVGFADGRTAGSGSRLLAPLDVDVAKDDSGISTEPILRMGGGGGGSGGHRFDAWGFPPPTRRTTRGVRVTSRRW